MTRPISSWRRDSNRIPSTRSSKSQFLGQCLPFAVNQTFGALVHEDFAWPGTRKSFTRPFTGGIDAHFGTEIRQARSVVERIDRAQGKLNIALGIDVVQYFERDLAQVLHVDVFVNHDDAFREHRLS